jgi:transposase
MVEQYKPRSDSQWEGIKVFLNTERKRKIDLRDVVDTICHIVRCGIQWRAFTPVSLSGRASIAISPSG